MTDEELGETTPEENQEGEEETPETPPEKTEEDKSKDLQSALAQKDHFRTKAEKLEKELQAIKSSKKEEPEKLWEAPNDPLEIVRLGKTLKDYTEEETEFIIRNASSKDIKGIMEAEKDVWVRTAIKAQREKVVKEKALNPSTQQPEPMKERTFTEKLKEANLSEKEKLLEEVGLWKSPRVRPLKDRIPLSR